jgi:hypothetical protein
LDLGGRRELLARLVVLRRDVAKRKDRITVIVNPTVRVKTVPTRSTSKVASGVFIVPCASTLDW